MKNTKPTNEVLGSQQQGAPTFHGGPYGKGGKAQLEDPTRQEPPDFEKVIDDLVAAEMDDMFGGSEKPIWTEASLAERNVADAGSTGIGGGFPGSAMDTIVAKRNFVPVDPTEKDNVNWLGPTVGGVPLNGVEVPDTTINNWKATTPQKMGKKTIDINALVRDQEIPESAVIIPKESRMSAKNLLEFIDLLIAEELELTEAEELGTQAMSQNLVQSMVALSQKHGGKGLEDYERVVPKAEQEQMIQQGNAGMNVSKNVFGSKQLGTQPATPIAQKVGGLKKQMAQRTAAAAQAQAAKDATIRSKVAGLRKPQPQQATVPTQPTQPTEGVSKGKKK